MKKIFFLISLTAVSTLFIASTKKIGYNTYTPDRFAKELLEVLKKQDIEEYKIFYPTIQDFKNTISSKVDTTTNQWYKNEASNSNPSIELLKSYDQYQSVIDKGKTLGIDWSKIKYDTIIYTAIETKEYGIQVISEMKVNFISGDKYFYVKASRIPQLTIGWRGGSIRGPYAIL